MPTNDERMFAMLIYLIGIFVPVLGPLIIWLMKREESDFVDYHGKEYFNYLISFTIYVVVSTILMVVLIGFLLIFVVGITGFILLIVALVKANQGERYRIPLIFRIIK
ncbi:DUF4870 domain-containing protein [Virgibacillus soli]|uniref:DUF4870 domain-containing protein n=1 Tax=Paracerasibacillus soli TaxID=480284 RepID=A0ABU5CNM2_9BACI|nr:DUF4870 domain-containing protein [Virgibacillus soli]MDY0407941.1 DUF4870 domain-containing protein [Virgibacillus soli]